MNTKYMADILEDILKTSRTSAETLHRRTIYNGDVLGSKIETLVLVLRKLEEEQEAS